MADIHESVGHLTLTGKMLLGLADSDDVGDQTDVTAPVAVVSVRASIDDFVVIADESIVALPEYAATLNADGQLVAPSDGRSAVGTSTSLRLIAPNQDTISKVGWRWIVTVRPTDGRSFKEITVYVDGAPGDVRTLGGQILAGQTPSVTIYPGYIPIEGVLEFNDETDSYVFPVPCSPRERG